MDRDHDGNLVHPEDGCPTCGQHDADELVWLDDDSERVECQRCGTIYAPGDKKGGDHATA